ALKYLGAEDAVAAGPDHLRHDVVGLLDDFDAGLRDPAVIERVGVHRFDLGQHRRVVGFLRVQLIAPQHLHAALLGLPFERIGDIAFPEPLICGPIAATTLLSATILRAFVAACAGSYCPAVAVPSSSTMTLIL